MTTSGKSVIFPDPLKSGLKCFQKSPSKEGGPLIYHSHRNSLLQGHASEGDQKSYENERSVIL